MLRSLLRRDLRLAWRNRGDAAAALIFQLLVVSLFPLALGSEPVLLAKLAPAILLIGTLLAALLEPHRLFHEDWRSGTLDALALSRVPLALVALAAALRHWLGYALPLLAGAPVLALLLNLPFAALPGLLLALALAGLAASLLAMLGQALVLGARRAGLLLPLLLTPFFAPILIFAAPLATAGFSPAGVQALYFLAAITLAYAILLPLLAGAALRSALESL